MEVLPYMWKTNGGSARMNKRRKAFNPGGKPWKLHREMGIPEGQTIPKDKLAAAAHSNDPEKRRDAIRAETMEGWNHTGKVGLINRG